MFFPRTHCVSLKQQDLPATIALQSNNKCLANIKFARHVSGINVFEMNAWVGRQGRQCFDRSAKTIKGTIIKPPEHKAVCLTISVGWAVFLLVSLAYAMENKTRPNHENVAGFNHLAVKGFVR